MLILIENAQKERGGTNPPYDSSSNYPHVSEKPTSTPPYTKT
jgi:hypothetical protein